MTDRDPESATAVNLHEAKDAGDRVRALTEDGTLQKCTDLNLEYGGGVDDTTLDLISSSCGRLQNLNLNACQQYTDYGLISLAKGCTGLSVLSLYWNVKITDKGVRSIVEANTSLVSLRLSGCKHLTDDGCRHVAQKCPNLTSLDLTRGWKDPGVASIVQRMSNLQVLDLCGSKDITDKSFEALGTHKMPHLRRLNLGWCLNLGDAACKSIAAGCPNLRYLYLLGNKQISMEGLKALSEGTPLLCGLDICGLCLVEDRSLAALSPMFPHLTLLAKLGQAPNYDDN